MASEVAEFLPSIRVDTHFSNVPDIAGTVDFDQAGYRNFLLERGLPEEKLDAVDVYLRPDYPLGYTWGERLRMLLKDPLYDTESASCEFNEGGGVTVTIVYGTAYEVNALLRHETDHVVKMLQEKQDSSPLDKLKAAGRLGPLVIGNAVGLLEHDIKPILAGASLSVIAEGVKNRRGKKKEEKSADALMYDEEITKKYGQIISIL